MKEKLFSTISDKRLLSLIKTEKMVAYFGIDPTGRGIHFGHLLGVSLLIELIKQKVDVIILVGGFTASIGDPTDKAQTRKKQEYDTIQSHSKGILQDLKHIFRPYKSQVRFVNNKQWLNKMSMNDLLEIGYKISMNKQLSMDTFEKRISNHMPLTLTEFLYPELQLMDFIHLNKKYGCNIQIGGQDQWGNISFGVHYLKSISGQENIFGICTPLITSGGKKLGKSEGAVFIKEKQKFYHYCMQMEDEVARFTENILDLKHFDDPIDQKKEICKYAFNLMFKDGEAIFKQEQKKAKILFSGTIKHMKKESFLEITERKLSKIMVILKASKTRTDAFNQINQGAVLINNESIYKEYILPEGEFKLSVGKKQHFFIRIT